MTAVPARPSILIARVVGILAIATGFVLGMEGPHAPDSVRLLSALGLIAVGLCAQVYAFCRAAADHIASRNHRTPSMDPLRDAEHVERDDARPRLRRDAPGSLP